MRSKVILVVFDGCRPDALAKANTPAVDALWQAGAYTWTAQTVVPSWTLPTHMSMFRGVSPQRHGVQENKFNPAAAAFPSIMDLARHNQLQTAMFYSWEELRDLSSHGSLTMSYYRDCYTTPGVDQMIAEHAAAHLVTDQPDLSLVYFCESDLTGHDHGWMSDEYIAAVENMDRALLHVVTSLQNVGVYEQYTWLMLADHGGHDHSHGSDHIEDTTIPWILSGAGIKSGHAIQTPVRIIDTAATIAHVLGLALPSNWEGQPIWDAFCE